MLRRKLRCSSSASRHFLACFDCREGRPGVIMQTKRVQYPINSNHVSLLWQSSLLFVSGLAISLHLLNSGIVEVRFDQMELVLPCGSRTIRDDINMQLTQASVKKNLGEYATRPTLLDLCVSSLRRGHANLLCIVPILTDDPRRESKKNNDTRKSSSDPEKLSGSSSA